MTTCSTNEDLGSLNANACFIYFFHCGFSPYIVREGAITFPERSIYWLPACSAAAAPCLKP